MSEMTAMTVTSVVSDMYCYERFATPATDFDGTALCIGDVVVETVMGRNGVQCPKMSDKPETFTVYLYGQDVLNTAKAGTLTDKRLEWAIRAYSACASQLVLIKSVSSGKYYLYPSSALCWIGSDESLSY